MLRFSSTIAASLLTLVGFIGCQESTPPDSSDPAAGEDQTTAQNQSGPAAGPQQSDSPLASQGEPLFPFEFSLTTVNGEPISLGDYAGQVVIVDIWGTWCPPCRMEVPSFIKLQDTYGDEGFQMIGINYEQADGGRPAERQLVLDFIEENGINYPCALGTEEIQAQVPEFRGFPTTLFIDRQGRVRDKLVGFHEYEALETRVQALLAE